MDYEKDLTPLVAQNEDETPETPEEETTEEKGTDEE